ncbi:MAG: M3 family oligoendopeptidase [Eubacteriales bacterium]|nr:M3 family oligoendopeptidase [Eubacteriales bacterium]MDD4323902.1 M3 family oligoendopeptidase [Eubacteriales bacterium]MDD4541032.1 M3 family oligoendopeptidase [Eubacteriales bacterium]
MQETGRWDLSPLYESMDDPKIEEDFAKLTKIVEGSRSFFEKEADAAELIKDGVKLAEELSELVHRLAAYFSLLMNADTSISKTVAYLNRIQGIMAGFQPFEVGLKRLIAKQDIDELVKVEELQHYNFMLRESKDEAAYLMDAELEELIAHLDIYGVGAWENLFDQLTSTVSADFDGEKKTMTELRNLAYDPDQKVRHQAYEAELSLYPKVEKSLSGALNSIKGQVLYLTDRRGHASPLDESLFRNRTSRKTLDAMIEAIIEKKDVFVRYYKAKARYFGQESLHWADMFAPIGKMPSGYTVEDSREMLVKSFEKLHPPIAEVMDKAYENNWIDFYPRENKVGGAFCSNLAIIKQSRVLSNFDGSFSAITTLAHELGHAYHGSRIEDHAPLNRSYSMPVAETASTFNERHFVLEQVEASDDPQVKLGLLDSLLMSSSQTSCDILSRFLFEQEVFARVENEYLRSEDLQKIMHEAQLKAYGDGLDEDSLHPYMWACKGHYYSASRSFYNYPYAFGDLFSVALYDKAQKEGSAFMEKYDEMLTATTVSSAEETGALVGLDLTDKKTWISSMESFEPLVAEFEKLIP